ncbi:hypothetical protein PGIGA_G00251540 [Pangasianodon gigas]|uniref:Uncharacterized protein n=1 Tax=Pangasianodon gigas TaxID=30993 RepID=A0ACC5WRE6_PANGG|nr:hypothetical protein [Pangasianodon gigas]
MARLLFIQLMIGVFTLSLLQITLADVISVHPGENVTLRCNITNYFNIVWYRLKSEEVKLLIIAKKGKLDTHFSPSSPVDDSHFDVTEDGGLVIIGVRETDLGFYYCGGQNTTTHIQFGKPIRLNFTDNRNQEAVASSAFLDRYQVTNIILTCVCSISFLMNVICICVFSSRVQGKLLSSHTCCSDTNTTYSDEKGMNLHYATFTHMREPADRNSSDLDRVIYTGIRHLPG